MNVYKEMPVFEGKNYKLRAVTLGDVDDLLKVYSDERAVPNFNGDNCHGDDFHYTTKERMTEAVKFWLWSYEQGYFVRWAIVDVASGEAVGTIELFHRDSKTDDYDDCGLLRLDIRSDHEKRECIKEILSLIIESTFDLFYCDKIATKVKPFAAERKAAVTALGFELGPTLCGNEGEAFDGYYVLRK